MNFLLTLIFAFHESLWGKQHMMTIALWWRSRLLDWRVQHGNAFNCWRKKKYQVSNVSNSCESELCVSVDLTNGQLTPNNNTPLLTQALSGTLQLLKILTSLGIRVKKILRNKISRKNYEMKPSRKKTPEKTCEKKILEKCSENFFRWNYWKNPPRMIFSCFSFCTSSFLYCSSSSSFYSCSSSSFYLFSSYFFIYFLFLLSSLLFPPLVFLFPLLRLIYLLLLYFCKLF